MNAIIMAAGTASRFVPLSEETPKGLLTVRGEVLIERQICQLREAGIDDICIVLGYKAEMFRYLAEKYPIEFVYNEDYLRYNNTSSVFRVLDKLNDTFICCSDHYFTRNVFLDKDSHSYYAAQFADGPTKEWCLTTDCNDIITDVQVGGSNAWYMAGHAYFSPAFSKVFRSIFEQEYKQEKVRQWYWEDVYIKHLQELPMRIRRYGDDDFREFDSIDELRQFDPSYITDTRSRIVKEICKSLSCRENELFHFERVKHTGNYLLFTFTKDNQQFEYDGRTQSVKEL